MACGTCLDTGTEAATDCSIHHCLQSPLRTHCTGFCGETEEEHAATLDLLRSTRYDNAFLFAYSRRDKTHAARHYADDVPQPVKDRRLQEVRLNTVLYYFMCAQCRGLTAAVDASLHSRRSGVVSISCWDLKLRLLTPYQILSHPSTAPRSRRHSRRSGVASASC